MAVIKLAGFTGEAPRVTPRLLPATGAQIALDVRLEDGELAPYRKPRVVTTLPGVTPGTVKTICRHLDTWLHWDKVVHAIPGPVAQDRLYFTGDGVPKMRVGTDVYDLKVTAPVAALTATNNATPGVVFETRLYVYTHVTDFGEESEPSPASNEVNVSPGNSVTLTGFGAIPAGRNITKQRIYRSVTGASGSAAFYFVEERVASAASFIDNVGQESFNEPLPSLDWNPPPDDLAGIVSMPNGMMAAFSGKELCFCEPYRPHAWPEKYRLTMDYDIVALGATGTSLVVGTKGNPYMVSGTAPDTMVSEKLELNLPCLNPQGMIDLGYSVVYPSNEGLVRVAGGGATVPSGDLLTRDQWLKHLPAQVVCGQFGGRFFASYVYTDTAGQKVEGTMIIDLGGDAPFLIRSRHRADAMFYDVPSGGLFMCIGDTIYEWDSRDSISDVMTYRSKAFVTPAPVSFGAIMVELDQRSDPEALKAYEDAVAAIVVANTAAFASPLHGEMNGHALNTYAINGDALLPLPIGPQITTNIYADGKFYASVSSAGRMQRLPGGKTARQWEIEVSGNVRVIEVTLATTGQELRSV